MENRREKDMKVRPIRIGYLDTGKGRTKMTIGGREEGQIGNGYKRFPNVRAKKITGGTSEDLLEVGSLQ